MIYFGKNMYLILLVGTNPLPNYVTALFLKDEVIKIFLVYSDDNSNQKGTQDIASWLKEGLIHRGFVAKSIELIPLENASSAGTIWMNLEALLLPRLFPRRSAHLNYTGGTKTMAVHVHAWLTKQAREEIVTEAVFSYLDARSNQLVFDGGVRTASGDLRNVAGTKIEKIDDLLQLHGYERKSTQETPFPEALRILKGIVEDGAISDFMKWKNQFRILFYQDEKVIEGRDKLLKHFAKQKTQDAVEGFNQSLEEISFARPLLKAFPDSIIRDDDYLWIPDENVTNSEISKRIVKPISGFLGGKWLEQYVLTVIKALAIENGLTSDQYGLSLEACKPKCKNFELDIFVLRGYQLIGISITTAGLEKCKNKAFEVVHRVQQIGGDESRSVLIGKLDDRQVTDMFEDISFLMTGTNEDHFKVIGVNQWKESLLKEELRRFIWQ
jgi:hypothetical protein